ncbi:hypothetical protein MTLP_12780 [Candidatus Methanoliparum sp. LAM-1]|nr:hypothetical protein MTLP_12780 [Candidatus Methanoliparum sp. LAM-1]
MNIDANLLFLSTASKLRINAVLNIHGKPKETCLEKHFIYL